MACIGGESLSSMVSKCLQLGYNYLAYRLPANIGHHSQPVLTRDTYAQSASRAHPPQLPLRRCPLGWRNDMSEAADACSHYTSLCPNYLLPYLRDNSDQAAGLDAIFPVQQSNIPICLHQLVLSPCRQRSVIVLDQLACRQLASCGKSALIPDVLS